MHVVCVIGSLIYYLLNSIKLQPVWHEQVFIKTHKRVEEEGGADPDYSLN